MKTTKSDDSGIIDDIGKWILGWKDKYKNANDHFFKALDDLTLEQAISKYRGYQKMLWVAPLIIWAVEIILFFSPFQTLDHQFLTLILELALIANLVGINSVNWFLMNLLTRQPKKYKEERLKDIQKVLRIKSVQSALTIGGALNTIAVFTLIPYYEFLRCNPNLEGWTMSMTDSINGNDFLIKLLIAILPIFITYNLYQLQKRTAERYRDQLEDAIQNKEYNNEKLDHMLKDESKEDRAKESHLPIITIGRSQQTHALVQQSVTTRRQNSIYFGAVGSGKSKTVFSSQIYQDIQHIIMYLRDYPTISKQEGFMKTRDNIATEYINGLALIDPTNDLAEDIYNLAKACGIPESDIVWFDPSNPHTAGFNLMSGPAEKVAENLTNVIAGVQEGSHDFFQESGRNHLKNYVYLLKLTSIFEKYTPTLADLKDMYDDIYVVRKRMKMLDAYLKVLERKLNKTKKLYEKDPSNAQNQVAYQELLDKEKIASSTLSWFKINIIPNRKGNTVVKRTDPEVQALDDKDPDKWEYIDAQAEFVRGLSNTLDDISKNMGLRRVLFRDSGEFNLDDAMYRGKILLFNTDKTNVGSALAKTLGQIYLGSLEAAVFRRKPNCVPLFPLYMDEFPDYLEEGFTNFASQSRKYCSPIVLAAQSPSQLSRQYGDDWFKSLVDVMLTVGTFGNMAPDSAELFERFFGTKKVANRSVNEQQVGLMKGMDDNRQMVTTRMEEVPNITADELMQMDKYTVAVRTPNPNGVHSTNIFNTIRTDYVDAKVAAKNPNNFNVNDPSDSEAYNKLLESKGIDNPDFDKTDSEIRQEYMNGDFTFELNTNGAKVIFKNGHNAEDTKSIINSKVSFDENGNQDKKMLNDTASSTQNDQNFGNVDPLQNGGFDVSGVGANGDNISTDSDITKGLFGNGSINTGEDKSKGNDDGNGDDGGNADPLASASPKKPSPDKPSPSQASVIIPPKKQDGAKEEKENFSNLFDLNEEPNNGNGGNDFFGGGNSNNGNSSNANNTNFFGGNGNAGNTNATNGNDLFGSNNQEQNKSANKTEINIPPSPSNQIQDAKTLKTVVDPDGKHGGSNRLNRDINVPKPNGDQAQATKPVQPTQPSQAVQATSEPVNFLDLNKFKANKAQEPKPAQKPATPQPQEQKKEDDMLKIDPTTGKLKEDNKNREEMEQRYLKRSKQNNINSAIDSMVADAETEAGLLIERKDLTDKQKIYELQHIRNNYKSMLSTVDPDGMPMELDAVFNSEEQKLKRKIKREEKQGVVFGGNGQSTKQSMDNLKDDPALLNSIKSILNQQEDPNIEVDLNHNKVIRNAQRDDDFNDEDPFYNQPGMKGDD